MNTTEDKVRKRIVRMLQDEVVPKYNKKKKKNYKSPIHYNSNYVARMYRQVKEEVQWE